MTDDNDDDTDIDYRFDCISVTSFVLHSNWLLSTADASVLVML